MNQHPQPFHLFVAEIADLMLKARAYPGEEWMRGQMKRLGLFYDTGESAESAASTMIVFGKAALSQTSMHKELTPLQFALKYGKVHRC